MLDFAELVVLNKFDKRGAEDALRDVRKQWKRNRTAFKTKDEDVPVYPTIASQFNDPGVTWMFSNLCRLLRDKLHVPAAKWTPELDTSLKEPRATVLIPGSRVRYLAEIAEQGRRINTDIGRQADAADRAQAMWQALREVEDPKLPKALDLYDADDVIGWASAHRSETSDAKDGGPRSTPSVDRSVLVLRQRYQDALKSLTTESIALLREWPQRLKSITDEHYVYEVRGKPVEGNNYVESLSHQKVPKIAAPTYKSWG